MIDLSKVSSLIFKLLALSKDGGATEAEAALAAEKAQALMTEHNLSVAAIEMSGGSSGDDGKRVRDDVSHRQVYKWQRTLMGQLAELNFCMCRERFKEAGKYYGSRTAVFDGYDLIGRASNVASTRIMFEYLLQTIERLAREHVQDPSKYFTRYAHSFKEGCSDRIIDRLKDKRRQEVEEQERKAKAEKAKSSHPSYAGSNALVAVLGDYVTDEQELNEDFQRGLPPGTTKARRLEYEREAVEYAAERKREREDKRNWLLATRPELANDHQRLEYLLAGFSDESIDKLLEERSKPSRPMTEAQRRKQEQARVNEEARRRARYEREASRIDWKGYTRGQDAGDDVGLDRQVDRNSTKSIK